MFTAVQGVVGRRLPTRRRDVPVSATKYPRPSYSNLGPVRHIAASTRKDVLHIHKLRDTARTRSQCGRHVLQEQHMIAYAEAVFAFALRR